MKTFKYNWATAEMMKMYLRNSCAQEKRKALAVTEVSAVIQDTPPTSPRLTVTGGSTGGNDFNTDSDDSLEEEE
jgi:hypothetical protein